MPQEFDPYHRWLGIPPEEQPADHYRLLGLVRFENDVEVIRDAAERQIAHVRRYGISKHSELSQRILNELAGAKAVLLDPDEKPRYDARLRREIESAAARTARGPSPPPTRGPKPAGNSLRRRAAATWRGLVAWFRRIVTSMVAALTRLIGRRPTQAKGPESIPPLPSRPGLPRGRGPEPQPPPLPSSSPVPPLPAAPAGPRGDVSPVADGPETRRVQEPADPFERLRRTAIESPENRALDEPPRRPEPAPDEKTPARKPDSQDDGTQVCQPATSLPTAVLWVLDDGQRTGQSVRMRRFPFLIGRTQGQVRIPHDAAIDDPHLEISWHADGPTPQLVVREVGRPFQAVQDGLERPSYGSFRGGLFVRAVKARIRVGQEIRIGSGCYRLVEPCVLEEVSPDGGRRLALGQPIAWLGRVPECEPLHMSQDRMADRHHAKLTRDGADAWSIEDQGSLNGTWLRVPQVVVRSRAEILIGEQALVIDIPRYAPRPRAGEGAGARGF